MKSHDRAPTLLRPGHSALLPPRSSNQLCQALTIDLLGCNHLLHTRAPHTLPRGNRYVTGAGDSLVDVAKVCLADDLHALSPTAGPPETLLSPKGIG